MDGTKVLTDSTLRSVLRQSGLTAARLLKEGIGA